MARMERSATRGADELSDFNTRHRLRLRVFRQAVTELDPGCSPACVGMELGFDLVRIVERSGGDHEDAGLGKIPGRNGASAFGAEAAFADSGRGIVRRLVASPDKVPSMEHGIRGKSRPGVFLAVAAMTVPRPEGRGFGLIAYKATKASTSVGHVFLPSLGPIRQTGACV